jgi:hypothetical protein
VQEYLFAYLFVKKGKDKIVPDHAMKAYRGIKRFSSTYS